MLGRLRRGDPAGIRSRKIVDIPVEITEGGQHFVGLFVRQRNDQVSVGQTAATVCVGLGLHSVITQRDVYHAVLLNFIILQLFGIIPFIPQVYLSKAGIRKRTCTWVSDIAGFCIDKFTDKFGVQRHTAGRAGSVQRIGKLDKRLGNFFHLDLDLNVFVGEAVWQCDRPRPIRVIVIYDSNFVIC